MRRTTLLLCLVGALALAVAGFFWLRASDTSSQGNSNAGPMQPAWKPPDDGHYFRDISEEAGVTLQNLCGVESWKRFIIEANGSGSALFDYDLDGDLDIYVVNGGSIAILRGEEEPVRNALYRNEGKLRFVDVTEEAGVGDTGWGYGCAVGDIDGDGDPDLYCTNYGPNSLYENLGDGTFREIAEEAGVADAGWGESTAFGDINNDGDLDLYVCNNIIFDIYNPPNDGEPCIIKSLPQACGPLGLPAQADVLYSNDGTGRFSDISDSSGIRAHPPRYGLGVVFADYNDDGWVDIYVANDSVFNSLFRNLGDEKFEEVAGVAGVEVKDDGAPQAGMGVDFGDIDGDGLLDILVTNFATDYNTLYRNAGDGAFLDMSYFSGLAEPSWDMLSWGAKFFDADNDGDLDIYVANGHVYKHKTTSGERHAYFMADQLFLNTGAGSYEAESHRIWVSGSPRSSRGAAFGDLDNDGDIDVLVVEMATRPTLLENVGGNQGNWLRLVLRGHQSNREGIGARIWLTVGEKMLRREVTRSGSYCSSHDVRVHFGLGEATRVDRIKVIWPSGVERVFEGISPVNRQLTIDEETGLLP